MIAEVVFKRCLIGLQKGVSKGLKEHLLQAQRVLVECRFIVFTQLVGEKLGQIGVFISLE